MSEMEKGNKLFEEFPPVSTEEWEEKIVKDLKGADYKRKLIWKTGEGFNVRPYYRQEDLDKIAYLESVPQQFPFVRGNKTTKNNWFIRQDIEADNLSAANKKALVLIEKGVNSFGFVVNNEVTFIKQDIATLLNGLPLAEVEINFIAGKAAVSVAKAVADYDKTIIGSIVYDPIMSLAKNGTLPAVDVNAEVVEMVKISKELPNFRAITIRADVIENAGSTIVQELGFALAAANEYMSVLTDAGISADDAANNIKFQFATGPNYFLELAKIRATRLLWANIVKQYQPKNEISSMANIHAVTSDWNKTIYDPYVNMLRTQTEAMSAILGGVDSMTVKGFNTSFEKPTEFSERIARNQQLLLKEESHFDKVVDPGAGSYYIENLTDSIAEQAWKLFLQVEDKGGFVASLTVGFIQKLVKETAQKRDINLANRKEILLGVNQYPNFSEHAGIEMTTEMLEKPVIGETEVEPLVKYRGAMAFEAMRYKTDVYSKSNKRPLAFMLTMGNLAMRKARAQFACNFFAVAGFEVLDNNGFETVEAGIEAAQAAKAEIIVICSSDEAYAEIAPEVKKQAGDAIVVIAGYPKAIVDNLKAAGIEHFVHVKSNVLETLIGFQKELGIN